MTRPPKILIFNSGLGGLTVFAELVKLRPHADYLYCADNAGFPYGSMERTGARRTRGEAHGGGRSADHAPDMVVIACNTASTIVLPDLRVAHPALRRHGAGDQAGGRAHTVKDDFGARDAGHGGARLFPKCSSRNSRRVAR